MRKCSRKTKIRAAENKLQIEANNGVIIQMYAILDSNSSGGYNGELSGEYARMAEDNGYDFGKANCRALEILKEKISKNHAKMFYLIASAICVRNKYIFFILLCILGGGIINLVVESQGRYKYSIEPLWCRASVYGICCLFRWKVSVMANRGYF